MKKIFAGLFILASLVIGTVAMADVPAASMDADAAVGVHLSPYCAITAGQNVAGLPAPVLSLSPASAETGNIDLIVPFSVKANYDHDITISFGGLWSTDVNSEELVSTTTCTYAGAALVADPVTGDYSDTQGQGNYTGLFSIDADFSTSNEEGQYNGTVTVTVYPGTDD